MTNQPPGLMPFSMTEAEIEKALDTPLEDTIRLEAKLLAEKPDKVNHIKRVVATGKAVWDERGDRSLSRLITHLLYLYFTGHLQVGQGTTSRLPGIHEEMYQEVEWSESDDADLDFEFPEG